MTGELVGIAYVIGQKNRSKYEIPLDPVHGYQAASDMRRHIQAPGIEKGFSPINSPLPETGIIGSLPIKISKGVRRAFPELAPNTKDVNKRHDIATVKQTLDQKPA